MPFSRYSADTSEGDTLAKASSVECFCQLTSSGKFSTETNNKGFSLDFSRIMLN